MQFCACWRECQYVAGHEMVPFLLPCKDAENTVRYILKCVQKPINSQLSLTHHANKSSRRGELKVAQLSQRDRAAGWVSYGQKWKTATGRQYFTDINGLSLTTVT